MCCAYRLKGVKMAIMVNRSRRKAPAKERMKADKSRYDLKRNSYRFYGW